jgi:hypothetical protein
MFGVLVVVLCPDCIAGLGCSLGEPQIPLIASSRVVRALRLWAGGTRDAAGLAWRLLVFILGPFCMAHSLVIGRYSCVRRPARPLKPLPAFSPGG